MCRILRVGSQVVETFLGLSIISSLLSYPCFPLDFQLSLLVAGLPTDVWHPTPSHQLWVRGGALCLSESQHSIPSFLSLSVSSMTSAAWRKHHVSPFSFPFSLTHIVCDCIPSYWPLCVYAAPSLSLCKGLYLARGIKISSCKAEAQKRSSGQLTWTQCAAHNAHLFHMNSFAALPPPTHTQSGDKQTNTTQKEIFDFQHF